MYNGCIMIVLLVFRVLDEKFGVKCIKHFTHLILKQKAILTGSFHPHSVEQLCGDR